MREDERNIGLQQSLRRWSVALLYLRTHGRQFNRGKNRCSHFFMPCILLLPTMQLPPPRGESHEVGTVTACSRAVRIIGKFMWNTLSSRNNKFWHTSCRVDVTEDDRVVYCKVVVSFPLFLLVTQIPETAANMSFNHHVVFSHVSPTSFLTIWRIICCFPRRF